MPQLWPLLSAPSRKHEVMEMSFVDDVRYVFRQIRFNRGFALISVLILTIGIGANTSIFALANALLFRPLPYPNPHSLIRIDIQNPQGLGNDTLDGSAVTFLLQKRPADQATAFGLPQGSMSAVWQHRSICAECRFLVLTFVPLACFQPWGGILRWRRIGPALFRSRS